MAFNFPNSPTVGQLYPATVIAGQPQYKWSGSVWQNVIVPAAGGGGGIAARVSLHTGSQTGIALSTWTKALFDTTDYNHGGAITISSDHSRFTPTVPGDYAVIASVCETASGATLQTALTAIYKNGAAFSSAQTSAPQAGGVAGQAITVVADVIPMNGTTDYLECFFYGAAPAGGTINAGAGIPAASTYMSIELVGGPAGATGPQGPPGPVPEAPLDGKTYGRSNAAWTGIFSLRTRTVLTSGSGTYTTKANCVAINVRMVGGGGGGAGSSTSTTGGSSTAGGTTTFGSLSASGGGGSANAGTGGGGGLGSGGDINLNGGTGGGSSPGPQTGGGGNIMGGSGGGSCFGGTGGAAAQNPGHDAGPPGAGGSGAGGTSTLGSWSGGGGGAGGYCEKLIVTPAASYAYNIGTGGAAGVAGSGGFIGGNGAAGIIIVDEYY